MSLAVKVAHNTLAQLGGKIVGTFLGLATVGIMTRYLGQSGFGEYTTVITFASLFAIIADMGLTLVSTQMINRHGAQTEEALSNLFGFRLVSAVVIIGLAPALIWLFPYPAAIKSGVVIVSWSYLFISFNQVFVSLFQRELKTHIIAIAEIASRLVLLAGVIAVAWYNWGLNGILVAAAVSSLLSFLLHYGFSLPITKVAFKFNLVYWREIFSRSWPLLTTIVLNLVYLKADILILSLIRTQAEVGLYGAAYKVVDVVVTLPFLFAGLVLPILVKHWSSGERGKFAFVAQKVFDVNVLAVLPLLAGGWLLANPGMRLVAGDNFAVSGEILKILLLAVVAVFGSCFFTHLMISFEAQRKLIKFYLITALTALPIYLYAISRWSYWGAAWGTVYSESLILVFSLAAVWRQGHFMPQLNLALKALVATAIMSLVIVGLSAAVNPFSPFGFVLVLVAAVASYSLTLGLMGVLKLANWQEFLEAGS
jgi:O-antigen/teichoic acid export membrane protein